MLASFRKTRRWSIHRRCHSRVRMVCIGCDPRSVGSTSRIELRHQNVKRYAAEVGKATGGALKINVHAGGALGFKGPEHLRAVRDGLVPMADVLGSQQIGDEPLFGWRTYPSWSPPWPS